MNTLHDLRATLDQHAHDITGDPATARVAAVHGRARVVRRRRAAGVGAAAALAVGAAGVLTVVGQPAPGPAAAPDTLTATGWRYQLEDTARTDEDALSVDLPASDLPRLVSWSTSGDDQDVVLRYHEERIASDVADFGDYTMLPPGFEGQVRVSGPEGLVLATYAVDTSFTPEGVGSGLSTFREDVVGLDFLGAAEGAPGQASVEVEVQPGEGKVWLGYHCSALPRDARININWVGARGAFMISGGCGSDTSFDPGGSAGTGFEPGARAGTTSTLRLWITRGGEPVADGDIPDLRLGLGAYTPSTEPEQMAGIEVRRTIEHDGHAWELVDVAVTEDGEVPRIEAPAEGAFLVSEAVRATGTTSFALTVDGRTVEGEMTFAGGGAGGGGVVERVPAGGVASLQFSTPVDQVAEAGLALYRRVG